MFYRIYYFLEDNGATILRKIKSAQEELAALSGINAENTGKEGYDGRQSLTYLIDIKAAIANAKKNNSNLTADVRKIVEET